jgi:predicted Fe-Mo cluster-binding NifX family protein
MKVAITSTGNSPDSKLDTRFGLCSYFVIFDTVTGSMEILPNPYREAEEGAGTDSVNLLASKGAGKIISGEFGIKIKPLLDSLKIQMIILKDEKKSVQDIINMLNH